MSIVAQCPKCQLQMSLPDEIVGEPIECRMCRHYFTVQTPPAPIAAGEPPHATAPVLETSLHTKSANEIPPASPVNIECDPESARDVERGIGWLLARLGFRLSSPLGWLGAIFLFFLPWVEIRCVDQGQLRWHVSKTGAQLAWGGKTVIVPDARQGNPNQRDEWTIWQVGIAIVLTLYLLGLALAIGFQVFLAPVLPTTFRMVTVAVLVFWLPMLLLLGGTIAFLMGRAGFHEVSYAPAYGLSFVANLWALLSFGAELWFEHLVRQPCSFSRSKRGAELGP